MTKGREDSGPRKKARVWLAAQLKATGGMPCGRCGRLVTPEMKWHAGHIDPHRDGGSGALHNFQVEHAHCNTSEGGKAGAAITHGKRASTRRRAATRSAPVDPRNTMPGW